MPTAWNETKTRPMKIRDTRDHAEQLDEAADRNYRTVKLTTTAGTTVLEMHVQDLAHLMTRATGATAVTVKAHPAN